jgi:hypothetical protein
MAAKSCLNCGAELRGSYCAACGQKDVALHRPFHALAGELLESAFNFESRTWQTLTLLLALPGLVTRRYVAGQRARYIGPVKAYAFLTFVFFVVLNLSGIALVAVESDPQGRIGVMLDENDTGEPRARMVGTGFTIESFVPLSRVRASPAPDTGSAPADLPGEVDPDPRPDPAEPRIRIERTDEATRARLRSLLAGMNELTTSPDRANQFLEKWLPRLLILLVPLFALVLKLVFVRRRVLLHDHVVFSLYFHASVFLLLTILVLLAALLPGYAGRVPFAGIFFGVATLVLAVGLRQAYGGTIRQTALRFAAGVTGYVLAFTAALNVLIYYGLR